MYFFGFVSDNQYTIYLHLNLLWRGKIQQNIDFPGIVTDLQ